MLSVNKRLTPVMVQTEVASYDITGLTGEEFTALTAIMGRVTMGSRPTSHIFVQCKAMVEKSDELNDLYRTLRKNMRFSTP